MSTPVLNNRLLGLLNFAKVHQRHADALIRATGENFNIFQILRVGHLEVKTHSPFLAELLDPSGRHGQGPIFLRLFLSRFNIRDFDAESETARVRLEYHIGRVTERSGGRIDVVLNDGNGTTVLIENKIYAGDQENQIIRYKSFDLNAHVFYLTLDGREPDDFQKGGIEGVTCISYGIHILGWLNDCRKESACLPIVRESITQYIHLIQELTNQSTSTGMNKELIDEIVGTKESLEAFFTLRQAESEVHAALIAKLDAELTMLAAATNLERLGPITDFGAKSGYFAFTTPGLRNQNLQICFEFDTGGFRNFFFGFALLDDKEPCAVTEQIGAEFVSNFGGDMDPYYVGWAWWNEYLNWGRSEFEAVRSGRFAIDLKTRLEILSKIARKVCPDGTIAKDY